MKMVSVKLATTFGQIPFDWKLPEGDMHAWII